MAISQPSNARSGTHGHHGGTTAGRNWNWTQRLMQEGNIEELRRLSGAAGVASQLRRDLQLGRDWGGPAGRQLQSHQSFSSFLQEACSAEHVALLFYAVVGLLYSAVVDNGRALDWLNALMVVATVFVPAFCNFAESYQFQKTRQRKEVKVVLVKRDEFGKNNVSRVPSHQVRLLDIVCLRTGDEVPADGLCVEGALQVDESWRTQESYHVHKSETQPFLYAGSLVVDGWGRMLVVAVGKNTRRSLGDYDAQARRVEGNSSLQAQLDEYVTRWSSFGRLMAFLLFFLFSVTYVFKEYEPGGQRLIILARDFAALLNLVLSMIVVAVPGGLHLSLPLIQRCFQSEMIASGIMVAKSGACYDLGYTTTILTSTSGVLTANKKRVRRAWVAGRFRDDQELNSCQDPVCCLLRQGVPLIDEGSLCYGEQFESQVASGSSDHAVLEWAFRIGAPRCSAAGDTPVILQRKLFSLRDKHSGVVARLRDGTRRAYCKGPAEDIYKKCTYYMATDETPHPMTDRMFYQIKQDIDSMACTGLRCIAFAFQNMVESPQAHVPEHDLTLLAIVGITDQCRLDVREAVASCRAAGVKVIMVTGDNVEAAAVKAQECAILTSRENIIEAGDLWSCGRHIFKEGLKSVEVVARMTPDHKTRLVHALQEMGEVVTVTGGGAEDAPALQAADVGVAVSGTEVAKASSDVLIISDDGFASVVKAVRWGRTMHGTIRRLLVFQGTASVVVLVLNFLAGVVGEVVPFDSLKLMWVSLIGNTLGAVALSKEPLDDEVMKQKPPRRHTRPVTPAMFRDMLGVGGFQVPLLLVVNRMLRLKGSAAEQVSQKNTILFNAFIVGLIVNLLSAKTPGRLNIFSGLLKSRVFLMVISFIAICQVLLVQFGGADSKGLDLTQWLVCLLIGVLNLPIAAAFKYFVPMNGGHHSQVTPGESITEGCTDMEESEIWMPLLSEG